MWEGLVAVGSVEDVGGQGLRSSLYRLLGPRPLAPGRGHHHEEENKESGCVAEHQNSTDFVHRRVRRRGGRKKTFHIKKYIYKFFSSDCKKSCFDRRFVKFIFVSMHEFSFDKHPPETAHG